MFGFGAWAALAPLDGAVVASGSFVANGQNKQVQHLEGGIIRDLRVREGDIVAVRANRALRNPDTAIPDSMPPIGVLRIVKANEKTATAFVIDAQEAIIPGDLTGGPMPAVAPTVELTGKHSDIIDADASELDDAFEE